MNIRLLGPLFVACLLIAGCGEKANPVTMASQPAAPDTTKFKVEALALAKANLERVAANCTTGSTFSNSIAVTLGAIQTRLKDTDQLESGYWVQMGRSLTGEGLILANNTNRVELKPKRFLTLPITDCSIIQDGDFRGFLLTTNLDLVVPGAQFYDRVFRGQEYMGAYKSTGNWPPRGTPAPVKLVPFDPGTNGSGSSPNFPKPNP